MQHENMFENSDWHIGSTVDVFDTIGQANGFDPTAVQAKVTPPVESVAEEPVPEVIAEAPVVTGAQAKIHVGRVRSGSRVVNETGDLIIMGTSTRAPSCWPRDTSTSMAPWAVGPSRAWAGILRPWCSVSASRPRSFPSPAITVHSRRC